MNPRVDDRGASAVEFALVVPFLLTLVFGIITFGFLFAQDLALSNASRQTARYGVIQGRTCDTLITEAQGSAGPLVSLAEGDVTVLRGASPTEATPVCQSADPTAEEPCKDSLPDDNLYVTLNYSADVLLPVIPGIGSTMDLDGQGVFRCEWS